MIEEARGSGLRDRMDTPLLAPESVVEEPAGGGEIMQGVMGQKNGGGRPGGPLLRPDDAVRKGHPHPVGTVFIFLVADPVEDDCRPLLPPRSTSAPGPAPRLPPS